MLTPGTYTGQIQNWGAKWFAERDEHKVYITFEIDGHANERVTWFGSLDTTPRVGRNGKPYTFCGITKGSLKSAGFKYEDDIASIVDKPDALEMGKLFSVTLTKTFGKDGKEYTNVSFDPLGADGKTTSKTGTKGIDLEGTEGAKKLRTKLTTTTQATTQTMATTEPLKQVAAQDVAF